MNSLSGIEIPMFQNQLEDIFGEPDSSGEFAQGYLRTMDFSEFINDFSHVISYTGNAWDGQIYGNYVLESPLRKALAAVVDKGLAKELKTFDGCFCIRGKKGGSGLSVHAWGLALDFNAALNPFGGHPTFSDDWVTCFAQAGFEWGGLWRPDSLRDGMHFQLPWIKTRTGPLAPVAWTGN